MTDDAPVSQAKYDDLGLKLAWRRSSDPGGRYLNVFIEQNNTCNLKCRMCGFSDPRTASVSRYHMPGALFAGIARQVFPATTYLHMSLMTEPFMTPDFPDRLALVRQYGVPYSRVVTNGTLLTETAIEKILDARITSLTFSIDGGTREIYESIRTGARFETVLGAIDLFRRARERRRALFPRLQINHVLMERNVDHFDSFLNLLEEIRPEQVDVRTVLPMTHATGGECMDPAFFEKVRRIRPLFADHCSRYGIEDCGFIRDQPGVIEVAGADGARMTCRRPWDTLAIHANGDLLPCMSWTRPPLGNLAQQTFEEIWNGAAADALRREFDAAGPGVDCQHCAIKTTSPPGAYDDFFFRMIDKGSA